MARVRVAKPTTSRSTSRNASSDAARDADTAEASPLLDLGPLEEGVLVCRPSSRNRSPYVGDVRLVSGPNAGSTCVTHLPNLDSGGKCRPGVRLLCRRQPGVGPDTVGKFGTPKCELVCQLLRCEEPENGAGVWVSAHPAIGEKLTQALMRRGAFDDRLFMRVGKSPAKKNPDAATKGEKNPSTSDTRSSRTYALSSEDALSSPVSSQVSRKREASASASGSFRPDFSVEHPDGSATVVECKQVVDTDYDPDTALVAAELQPGHPVYAIRARGGRMEDENNTKKTPYVRAGIFPWGARGQKGPDGEPVVSRRAIDHLRELSVIARGEVTHVVEDTTTNSEGTKNPTTKTRAAVVLMAGRHDVFSIRANGAACPSFAKHLESATKSGVLFVGHKVRWGEGADLGKAFDAGPVPIEAPTREGDEVLVPRPRETKTKKKSSASESKEPETKKPSTEARATKTATKTAAKKTKTKTRDDGDAARGAETSATAKRRRRGNTS